MAREPNPRKLAHHANDADRADGAFGALHDVSNALTVLLGWVAEARAAKDEKDAGEVLEHALAMVERRAREARDLARQAIGAHPADAEAERAIGKVVAEVVESLAVEAQRVGVRLVVRGLPEARRDARVHAPAAVTHVLTNLVMNALAFAPRESTVTIELEANDAAVRVDVQDEGPGIDASRAAKVFEGETTRAGGAGIGLRHARTTARAAGGELELLARGEGGARFRLSWPRADAVIPPAPLSASRVPVLAGRRVLVVEDDPDVVALLETALGARGAEVTIARTAGDLAAASAGEHDAALVDLSPIASDVDGALGMLRQRSPGVRVVFISGSAAGLPDALSQSAVRWVRKPFEVAEIVAALTSDRPGEGPSKA